MLLESSPCYNVYTAKVFSPFKINSGSIYPLLHFLSVNVEEAITSIQDGFDST